MLNFAKKPPREGLVVGAYVVVLATLGGVWWWVSGRLVVG